MRRLADYKLGFCWMRMALRIRHEALDSYVKGLAPPDPQAADVPDVPNAERSPAKRPPEAPPTRQAAQERGESVGQIEPGSDEHRVAELLRDYKKAVKSAANAACYFDSMNQNIGGGRENPVGYYNRACALSVVCQYSVETRLLSKYPHATASHIAKVILNRAQDYQLEKGEAKEDYVFLDAWRKECGDEFCKGIDSTADTALELLEYMRRPAAVVSEQPDSHESQPEPDRFPADVQWLVKLAREDSDLHFLRREPPHKSKFEQWLRRAGGTARLSQRYEHLEIMGATDKMGGGKEGKELRKSVREIIARIT
jgi:hypothetical protein